MMSQSTGNEVLLTQIISFCMRQGWQVQPLFELAGYDLVTLRIGQQQMTPQDYVYLLDTIAKKKDCPSIALMLGATLQSEHLGLFGCLISSSPNLTVAVQVFSQFAVLIEDLFHLEMTVEDDTTWLVFQPTPAIISPSPSGSTQKQPYHRYYSELLFSAIVTHADQLSRTDIYPTIIEFQHDQPAYHQVYRRYFQCELRFAQCKSRIGLPKHAAELGFVNGSLNYHQQLVHTAQQLIPEHDYNRSTQVAKYLRTHLQDAEACQMQAVATFFNRSARSIQRDLRQQGTTLKQLHDEIRHQVACEQLAQTTYSIEQIGMALGFKHPSSFSVKFKQWQGQTPNEYRNTHAL